jgi:hypothetical protein
MAAGGILDEDVTPDELRKKLEGLSTDIVTEDRGR